MTRTSPLWILLLLLWGGALCPGQLLAAGEDLPRPAGPAPAGIPEPAPEKADGGNPDLDLPVPFPVPFNSRLEAMHFYLSENVEALADKIDSFFGARRIYEESSGTYVQLRGTTIYGEGGEWEFDGRVRAKLDLPQLEERISLVVESESEDESQEDRILTGTNLTETVEDKDLAASVQYVLQAKQFWDVRLQPGLKVKWPLDPFVRVRFRWLNPLSQTWLSRVTVTQGWSD